MTCLGALIYRACLILNRYLYVERFITLILSFSSRTCTHWTYTYIFKLLFILLQETSEAYKKQNAYLTCEMVELNELRTADAQIIKSMKRFEIDLLDDRKGLSSACELHMFVYVPYSPTCIFSSLKNFIKFRHTDNIF